MIGLVGGCVFGVISGFVVTIVLPLSQTDYFVWLLMSMWIGERVEHYGKNV